MSANRSMSFACTSHHLHIAWAHCVVVFSQIHTLHPYTLSSPWETHYTYFEQLCKKCASFLQVQSVFCSPASIFFILFFSSNDLPFPLLSYPKISILFPLELYMRFSRVGRTNFCSTADIYYMDRKKIK